MNIVTIVILLTLIEELPELPRQPREDTLAARKKAIAHNRAVYHARIGDGIWYETPDDNGCYIRYTGGQKTTKKQEGRWATERLSGHRRLQKWSRDAYRSLVDEKAVRRWEDELKDYFG